MAIVFAQPSAEFLRFAAAQAAVYQRYAALSATSALDTESGLGGKLVFAGELATNADLLRAANIAGAASLAASADVDIQRQAMRDGVVDFIVTSLDEALRILKNEIRKKQPVSVAVALRSDAVITEMLVRGVLPDLLGAGTTAPDSEAQFQSQGAQAIEDCKPASNGSYRAWSVDRDFSRWMPLLDTCARSVLPAEDALRQRWLRLAPRYLGRQAQKAHGVAMNSEERVRFRDAAEEMLTRKQEEGITAPPISLAP